MTDHRVRDRAQRKKVVPGVFGHVTSMVRSLVTAHLRPLPRKAGISGVAVTAVHGHAAAGIGAEAAALAGSGIDLMQGECTIAGILVEESPRGAEHRLACAITNRRTIVGGYSSVKGGFADIAVSVGHDELLRVDSKDGILPCSLKLHAGSGSWELSEVRP